MATESEEPPARIDPSEAQRTERKKPQEPKPSRWLEAVFWAWTSGVVALLPLAPTVFASLTTHKPPLTPEELTKHGELLFASIAVSFTTLIRMEIDRRGGRGLRVGVVAFSLLTVAGAFLELLAVQHALDANQPFADGFRVSCIIYGLSLITSFFPGVVWFHK